MLHTIKNYTIWFLAFVFAASVSLPITGNATEVFVCSVLHIRTNHIQTLAASCAACHGSNGNAIAGNAVLAGIDPTYFTKQMLAFKAGSLPATVMHHHAKGLKDDEINLLAVYFSQQKPAASQAPKSQLLSPSHESP